MATNKTCPRESLHYAYRFEVLRADWLNRNHRTSEAIDAELAAKGFAARIRDEIGVEVD
jgi:hypothetical protein